MGNVTSCLYTICRFYVLLLWTFTVGAICILGAIMYTLDANMDI